MFMDEEVIGWGGQLTKAAARVSRLITHSKADAGGCTSAMFPTDVPNWSVVGAHESQTDPSILRAERSTFAAVHMAAFGPQRHLLRRSDTSDVGVELRCGAVVVG